MPDPVSSAIAGIGSAVGNIFGAQSAAQAQQQAVQQANAAALQQQTNGLQAQSGYFQGGNAPLGSLANMAPGEMTALNAALPSLTAPITMDEATLQQTPGYQWNLSQGERGVSLGAAAAGLSGAQAKAAATYATGLADSTYQNQFNNANTNKQNAYNFLFGTASLGANSAGQYGTNATAAGNAALSNSQAVGSTLSNNLIGGGNAQAAADIATGKQVGNMFGAATTFGGNSSNPFGNYGMYGATNGVNNYNSGNPIY